MAKVRDRLMHEVMPPISKTRITIMLDDDVIEYFRELGQSEGVGYQTRINASLREVIAQTRNGNGTVSDKRKRDMPVTANDLKKVLRKVVREELRRKTK